MKGLAEDAVILRTFTGLWQWMFLKEKLLLKLMLGREAEDIQHFGSTAIRGMPAKPIIDIIVGVADYDKGAHLVDLIEQLGYVYMGENSEVLQYYFTKGKPTRYNLYVNEIGSENWVEKIGFRDHLRRDSEAVHQYAELKRQLAGKFSNDLRAYQDGKLGFVNQILQKEEVCDVGETY